MKHNYRYHRWLGRLAVVVVVTMLATMLPVSALTETLGVSAGAGTAYSEASSFESAVQRNEADAFEDELAYSEIDVPVWNDDSSDDEDPIPVITGFDVPRSQYEFSYKPELTALGERLPGTVCMYVDGKGVNVDVYWQCDDYYYADSGQFLFTAQFEQRSVWVGDALWDIEDMAFAPGVDMPKIWVSVSAVTGFEPLKRTVFAMSRKPGSIEGAVSAMKLPDTVYGYINNASERTPFSVSWFCENYGADFSDEFIFSASFNGEQYALMDGVEMPQVTLKIVENDEFYLDDVDNANMTVTIAGWKYDDTYLVVPREIDGYTVTAIADRAFDDHRLLTSVELPDSIEHYGRNIFGSNKSVTEVKLTVGAFSTTLYHNLQSDIYSYIHNFDDIPVELPLPVTDIEVLTGASLYLNGDFTLEADHEILLWPADTNDIEIPGACLVLAEGCTLVNHGLIWIDETATFINQGTVHSCDIFSLIEGKIKGNHRETEHVFSEGGRCAYCDERRASYEIVADEKPTKVYDGTLDYPIDALSFHVADAEDGAGPEVAPVAAEFDAVDAGERLLTVTFEIYEGEEVIKQEAVFEASIQPRTLLVLPEAGQGKVYGEPNPEYYYALDGLVDGDACEGALVRMPGEDAGFYPYSADGLYAGENYTLELATDSAQFEIVPRPISSADILMPAIDDQYYTGAPLEPEVWLAMGDYLLEQGRDYEVEYVDNVDVGVAGVVVSGMGNYFGSRELQNFQILNRPVEEAASLDLPDPEAPAADDEWTSYAPAQSGEETPELLDSSELPDPAEAVDDEGTLGSLDTDKAEADLLANGEDIAANAEIAGNAETESQDYRFGNFYCNLYTSGSSRVASIYRYVGMDTEVDVPATVTVDLLNYTVITIESYAFDDDNRDGSGEYESKPIKSIKLPSTVNTVKAYAFYNCSELESFTMTDSITTIEDNSFNHLANIKTLKLVVNGTTRLTAPNAYDHFDETTVKLRVPDNFAYTDIEVNSGGNLTIATDFTVPAGHALKVNEGGVVTLLDAGVTDAFGDERYVLSNQGTIENNGTFVNGGTIYSCKAGSTVSGLSDEIEVKKNHCFDSTGKCAHCDAWNIGDGTVVFVADIADQEYTGEAIKPAISMWLCSPDGNIPLTQGTDFTVVYQDNVEPGTATATITGTGNYVGTREVKFNIRKKLLVNRELGFVLTGGSLTKQYDGTVKVNLSAGNFDVDSSKVEAGDSVSIRSITASYDSINAGKRKVLVRFGIEQNSNNQYYYTVPDLVYYDGEITKKDLIVTPHSGQSKEYLESYSIRGTATGLLNIDELKGEMGVASESAGSQRITAGTLYTVNRSTGKQADNYNIKIAEEYLTITPRSIEECAVTVSDGEYTGFPVVPTVTLTYDGSALKKDTDYTVTAANNVAAGNTASVTITAKGGNFTGEITTNFTIAKKPISDSDIVFKITGYSTSSSTTSSSSSTTTSSTTTSIPTFTLTHKSSSGTRTLVYGTDYTASLSNNTSSGTGVINITASQNGNYTGARTETYTVKKSSSSSSSSSGSGTTVTKTDYVYYLSGNGRFFLIVDSLSKHAFFGDVVDDWYKICDYSGTLQKGMTVRLQFPDLSVNAAVSPVAGKDKTYPDQILFTAMGERMTLYRVTSSSTQSELLDYTDLEGASDIDAETFESYLDAFSDDDIGELWLDEDNLGVVLYDDNYQPMAFEQSEESIIPVVGSTNTAGQKRLRIAPDPVTGPTGETKYPAAHLRLNQHQIGKITRKGYAEIAYQVGAGELRIPLNLLASELALGSGTQAVDAYDICIEPVGAVMTEHEIEALEDYRAVPPMFRMDVNAATGTYPESTAAELGVDDDADDDANDDADAEAAEDSRNDLSLLIPPEHPDAVLVAERLNYVDDVTAVVPVGAAQRPAPAPVEADTAGDEIEFIDEGNEDSGETENAEESEADAEQNEAPDGLIGEVYFSLKPLDAESVYKLPEEVLADGIRGGGVVEVYDTVRDASARDDALTAYDGTIFSASHRRFGACVIRTAPRFNEAERQAVEQSIIVALSAEAPTAVPSPFTQLLPKLTPVLPIWNGSAAAEAQSRGGARMLIRAASPSVPQSANAVMVPVDENAGAALSKLSVVTEETESYVELYPDQNGLCGVVEPIASALPAAQTPAQAESQDEEWSEDDTPALPVAQVPAQAEAQDEEWSEGDAPAEASGTDDEVFEDVGGDAQNEPEAAPAEPEPVARDPEPMYAYTLRSNGANMYWLLDTQAMTAEFYREDTGAYLIGPYTGSLIDGLEIKYQDSDQTAEMRLKFQQTYKFASTTVDGAEMLIEQGNIADVEAVFKNVRK